MPLSTSIASRLYSNLISNNESYIAADETAKFMELNHFFVTTCEHTCTVSVLLM